MATKSPYSDPQMAEFYAKASAKYQFQLPAEDLVTWLKIQSGERVLDIGSGTGAVASAASRVVGLSGIVVALDGSIEMLRQQPQSAQRRIAACVPGLPFAEEAFDAVSASFVLSHIRDYPTALAQIHRVLQPAGRFGVTAWALGTPRVSEVWKSVTERFVNMKAVQEEFARIIPWDEFFSQSIHMEEALNSAGFVDVRSGTKEYQITITPQEYIATKIGSIEGTIVRDSLEEKEWNEFLSQLLVVLQKEFPGRIEYSRNVNFTLGRKPF
jgi:ubiquinone/menaquinone biosynthesis C-methylase UbiE